jgi:uncharacterized protein (TIGR03435 family)
MWRFMLIGLAAVLQAGPPAFAAATITASQSDGTRSAIALKPDGVWEAKNVTFYELAQLAYQRHALDRREIRGAQPWMESERFDVIARATGDHVLEPDGYPAKTWKMLQALLADRFNAQSHTEVVEQQGYALRVAGRSGTLGPQLIKSDADCADIVLKSISGERPSRPRCGFGPYPRRLTADSVTMPALAGYLSRLLQKPVVDQTGLPGAFSLEVEGVEVQPPGPLGPSSRASETTRSIVELMPAQLGLALEPMSVPVEILVIDHAERPTGP